MKRMSLKRNKNRKSRAKRQRENSVDTEFSNVGVSSEFPFGLSVQWAHRFPFFSLNCFEVDDCNLKLKTPK